MKPALFAAFAALVVPAWGTDEILEESFPSSKYGAVEAPLQATGGKGGGFTSSWRQYHDGEGRPEEMALYVPEGLEYTDSTGQRLKTEGGAARLLQGPGKPAMLGVERPLDCSQGGALAQFCNGGSIINQGTVYVSYLIQAGVMNNVPYQMFFSLEAGTVGVEDGLRTGFANTAKFEVQRLKDQEVRGSIQQPLPGDFPMLVVMRILFSKDGKATEIALWLNPTLCEERDPDNVLFLDDEFSFRSILLGNIVGALFCESNVVFDEIRIGPTFASVTPKG